MAGPLEGRVALITGAARGQGRSHALRLARDGADIIAVDILETPPSLKEFYPLATQEDMDETVKKVEALDRRIVARRADVRDLGALTAAVDEGVAELGKLNIVVANAGIYEHGQDVQDVPVEQWNDVLDTNLTGAWHTVKAALPHLVKAGAGGSVVLIASLAGLKGLYNNAAYVSSKHGLVGLMKVLVNELGPKGIRANTIHPNTIDTLMVKNDAVYKLFRPELENPTLEDAEQGFASLSPMGKPLIEPEAVSNAVAWLASDESYYVSGATLPVDGGASQH